MYDTHCHLDETSYDEDLEILIQRAKQNGVKRFIIPGADPKNLPKAQQLSHQYEEIYFAVGVHPYHIEDYDESFLRQFVNDDRCVAIGECGLDYFRLPKGEEEKNKEQQKEVFKAQINLAREFNKPLILHVREASNDTYELLKENEHDQLRGVLHCYNADAILLKLSSNFYYGIGGVLTFKNAKRLVNILPQIPLERIVLETDAPYLTPEPHRGTRNSPEYIPIIAAKISDILGVPKNNIQDITTQNANELFWGRNIAS